MSRIHMRLVELALAWLLCCFAVAPLPAQVTIDSRWGVLGEMAEQDFKGSCVSVSFRWIAPNRTLEMICSSLMSSGKTTYTLDPATGDIENKGYAGGAVLKAQADGSVARLRDNQSYTVFSRNIDGSFKWSGMSDLRPTSPGDRADRHVAKLIAAGKIRSANRQLAQAALPDSRRSAENAALASVVAPGSRPGPPAPVPVAAVAPSLAVPLATGGGPRLALIIGNSKYGASLGDLANPANDAMTMSAALQSVGFQVEMLVDADQKSIKRAIARFGERLRAAGRGSTGLFFYAGHGIQSRGTNYLIPIGAAIEAEADVDLESVAADTVLLQMEEAGSSTNIVILDACRNMPVSRSFRSGARGLARMEAPNGSFVAYSTAPGAVAADGEGKNSPFVTALAQQISRKGQPIEVIFRDVRRSVLELTAGKQTPWDSSSLISPFYFVGE